MSIVGIRKLVVEGCGTKAKARRPSEILIPSTYSSVLRKKGLPLRVRVRASAFCVIDRKRISSSNQVFQRTHPLPRTPGERVGRVPAGVAAAEKSMLDMRYMAQCTEPHGASLRSATSGVADCCNPCVQCRETNRTGCPILVSSHPEHEQTGASASLVWFWKATAILPVPCITLLSAPSSWQMRAASEVGLLAVRADTGTKRQGEASASPPNGDLRVEEDMTLLAIHGRLPAARRREAPIAGREGCNRRPLLCRSIFVPSLTV